VGGKAQKILAPTIVDWLKREFKERNMATDAKETKVRVPLVDIDEANKKRLQELGGEFLTCTR
jgi:hypothetical protein